jgi:glycosyltransferase involved in cell wall biosynthesis
MLVSAIIPTIDRPKLLQRAISSVEGQTYDPIELIVVGSPESTDIRNIVEDTGINEPIFISSSADSPAAARNKGIDKASGELIAFLDDDEEWDQQKIEKQVDRMSETGAGACHTGVRKFGPEGKFRSASRPTVEGDVTEQLLRQELYGEISAMMVRRKYVEKIKGFDERFFLLEDGDFNIQISLHTNFCTVSEPLATRYAGGHDHATDDINQRIKDQEKFIQKYSTLAREYGKDTEKRMISNLKYGTGKMAAAGGLYRKARMQFLSGLKADPLNTANLVWLCLVIGGEITFKPAQSIKRRYSKLMVE